VEESVDNVLKSDIIKQTSIRGRNEII